MMDKFCTVENTPLFFEEILFEFDNQPMIFVCVNKLNERFFCVCINDIAEEEYLVTKINDAKLLDILYNRIPFYEAFSSARKTYHFVVGKSITIYENGNIPKDVRPEENEMLEMPVADYIKKIRGFSSISSSYLKCMKQNTINKNYKKIAIKDNKDWCNVDLKKQEVA